MKENMQKYIDTMKNTWNKRTKSQKNVLIGSFALIVIIIFGISLFNKTQYVPLYSNLSLNEVSQIKAELDDKNISYEITEGGTTIKVPEKQSNTLLVEFAGQGIPSSGNIDYSFFSENASWGITDNEFSMIKLGAMQTELANLIKSIEGITDANVMLTLPKESVFVNDASQHATASIILNTQMGQDLSGKQIESLYHLVSKAVPNLPKENIHIMNQFYETYDQHIASSGGEHENYTYQQTVKKDIERDIEQRLQQMLGVMVGMDSVIVSVTADIDFRKENRIEEIIDPVDIDNMEGLPISIETIHETYTGNGVNGGIPGSDEGDGMGYDSPGSGDDGEYELVKETINNEYNRIRKDIVESPYKIRDLGIQVAVNNVKDSQGNEVEYLSQQEQSSVRAGIESILNSMINTSVDKAYGEINPEEKISIVFQEFSGVATFPESIPSTIPVWMYVAGTALLLIIIVLIVLLLRNRRSSYEAFEDIELTQEEKIEEISTSPETESTIRKKQLEKMATSKPEDFAKLLRSWIVDD